MALQLWMGNAGSGKSYGLYQHIIKESEAHPELTYLVVVPEQFTLQTQRDLVMLHQKHGIMNIDILSFARLAYRVFEEVGFAGASGILIDDMGKSLILRRLAGQYEDRLQVLGKNLKRLGYINEVKSVISEFMQYGIQNEEIDLLKQRAETSGKAMLNRKLSDIQVLFNAFRGYIDEKYTTSEEILERVSGILPDSEKIKRSVIVFDGFTGFTPVQYKLIAALLRASVDVYMTILLDTKENPYVTAGEQELFYLSKKTIRQMTGIAESLQVERKPDHVINEPVPIRFQYASGMLAHLEKNLFRPDAKSFEKPKEEDEAAAISIFTGTNPEEEMKNTAVRILSLIQEQGYRYRDIAIVTGDIDTYMHAAQRVFTRYGIPYFVDKTQPILLNPFIEYMRAVISILADDYSYEGMFRYLKSSLTEFDLMEIDRLENYVLACGIKGSGQWNRHFIRKTASMKTEELLALDALRAKIVHAFEPFHDIFNRTASVKSFANAFYQFIVRAKIQEKLTVYENHFMDCGDKVKAKEYAQVYKQVIDLLDKLVELLGDERMTIREFGELLDAGFDEIRIGVIPPGTDYIQIGDITRTRIGKIKVLFFAGVNDGIIPSGSGRGGIISDMDREFLQEDGIELAPSSRMQSYTQRLYLYMAMTKPEERLYLSYAKLSEDGRSLRPSYLIKTVREMFVWIKEEKAADVRLVSRIWNENAGFRELTEGLQPYIAWRSAGTGTAAGDDMQNYRELFSLYASKPEYGGKLKTLIDTAFLEGVLKRRDSIGRAVAEVLYGKELSGSVTRLESYARCAYQHFLTYGIGLKERELFSFEAKDMGTVFHDALLTYAKLLEKSGYTWFDIPALKAEALIDEAVRRCVASGDYAAVYSSFRTAYMVERIKRITMRTVEVLTGQIRKGSFRPEKFEFVFSAENDYHTLNIKLSKEESLRLRGRIDRLDVYEDDTQIYVKIIDYKSGKQSFDLAAIYQGLQLQLVVYLNAAMEQQQGLSAKKEIIPAGILYYHIDDPMIDAGKNDTPEDISRRIVSQLAMKGLVNSSETIIRLMDRDFEKVSDVIPVSLLKTGGLASGSSVASTEEFKIISDYVNWKIKEMGKGILSGNIMAMPAKEPEACAYCSYRSICHYTGKTDGDGEEDGMERPAKEDVIDRMKENICPKEGTKQ